MRRLLALAAAALALPPVSAQGITVTGSNTVRIERYDTDGFAGASPFPFSTTTGFDELVLDASWQPSSFDRWRALFAGVANDSPYRSTERGFVPERMSLARENGEGAIAYRAEVGDFFAFTSVRTQMRPLKGAAIELQPALGNAAVRTSILLFGGAFQPSWRRFQWSDDNALGLSWLTEAGAARFMFNAVRNERAANAVFGTPERRQNVASIGADAPFRLGRSAWRAEAELAGLRGDPDGLVSGSDGDRSGTGLFAQLSGTLDTTPLSWRLRGERYGRDYRPIGAAIAADRRAAEAHVSWQSPQALFWRARWQDYRDEWKGPNPLDTQVIGAAVSGPIAPWNATMTVDVFRQALERRDGSLDQRNLTANAFLSAPVGPVVGQLAVLYQRVEDRIAVDASPRTKQLALSITAPLQFGPVNGSIAPGVTWREVTGSAFATRDVNASLQLALFGGPHRFSLNAGRLVQDPATAPNPEVATVNFGMEYRYRLGRHELGADLVVFDRNPRPGEATEAYRAGLTWVYSFDALPGIALPAMLGIASRAPASGPLPRDAGVLTGIAPGDDLDATLARLSASGIAGGTRLPGAVVFETRVLPEVDERQRLALAHANGRVERAVLIVSMSQDAAGTYERVRRALIERLGRPATTFEEGTFGAATARDVASGRLIRIAEWRTDRGILRLGIPRRLDGAARIEVHHAPSFPSPRDTRWGLDGIR